MDPSVDRLSAGAPAKINLSLSVLGRRTDGYHELESLVAFAADGATSDRLSLRLGGPTRLEIGGAERSAIEGQADNLVLRAARAASASCPALKLGTFRLEKVLPVAAGIGGGSADAAAALRLIRLANLTLADGGDWPRLAASIGADVPVCLASRAAVMRGIGERVELLAALPPAWAVLVNPRVPLATARVFGALDAPPLDPTARRCSIGTAGASFEDLIEMLGQRPNDLEATATRLCPEIAEARSSLERLAGVRLTRMSGSGPTCFGLFATEVAATAAAGLLASRHPDWWVAASRLV